MPTLQAFLQKLQDGGFKPDGLADAFQATIERVEPPQIFGEERLSAEDCIEPYLRLAENYLDELSPRIKRWVELRLTPEKYLIFSKSADFRKGGDDRGLSEIF